MTTFADMRKFTSVKDFTADTVRELIGDYCVRGKAIDLEKADMLKLLNRNDWIVNRVGRVMDVAGKIDPAATSFRLDRDTDNILHVRIVDSELNTLYTIDIGEKDHLAKGDFQYIVRDADGNELVRDARWKAVTAFFAPAKETPVKKAAAPKKPKAKKETKKETKKAKTPKKEKAVKAAKSPVPAQPADTDVVSEVDAILNEDPLPPELG